MHYSGFMTCELLVQELQHEPRAGLCIMPLGAAAELANETHDQLQAEALRFCSVEAGRNTRTAVTHLKPEVPSLEVCRRERGFANAGRIGVLDHAARWFGLS